MDQIAVISDIHGNIPALQATLHDIQRRKIGRIFCLGDLVGKGPHSDEAVDICREVCEITIRGNWDDFIHKITDNPNDIEGAIRQAEAALMPELDAYADELRTARYRGAQVPAV
jgi:protein phosphatase